MNATFIRLENTLEKALRYYNSPQMNFYSFAGVHLLPGHPYPYKQQTYADEGIEIELVLNAWVCDMCGNRLADIRHDFTVIENFNDPDTGLSQVIWQLNNVEFDAGYQMVYLELFTGFDNYFYSSPFMLTADYAEYTARFDYRNESTAQMLSAGLRVFFRQNKSTQELSNYNPVATGKTFTASSVLTKFEKWYTDIIDVDVIEKLKEIFLYREIYSLPANFTNQLPVRTGLNGAIETPDLEGNENFTEQEINFLRNYGVVYDPLAPIVTPPTPTPDDPVITLTSVKAVGDSQAKFEFTKSGFATAPTYLVFQYSPDGVVWFNSTFGPNSPQTVNVANVTTIDYFYRIYYPPTETYSNIVHIEALYINIYMVKENTPGLFGIYWSKNFDLVPGASYTYECTNSIGLWQPVTSVSSQTETSAFVTLPRNIPVIDRVRVKYTALAVTSNTFLLP